MSAKQQTNPSDAIPYSYIILLCISSQLGMVLVDQTAINNSISIWEKKIKKNKQIVQLTCKI